MLRLLRLILDETIALGSKMISPKGFADLIRDRLSFLGSVDTGILTQFQIPFYLKQNKTHALMAVFCADKNVSDLCQNDQVLSDLLTQFDDLFALPHGEHSFLIYHIR